MTVADSENGALAWDVPTIKRAGLGRDVPPGKEELMWVSNSAPLIYGERDAVLVDTCLTAEQGQTLVNWVVANGKVLTTICQYGEEAVLDDRFDKCKDLQRPCGRRNGVMKCTRH